MVKYIKVTWPDTQYYETHERFGECYDAFCTDDEEGEREVCLMVPEDLYEEIEENKLYPAKINIPKLGVATVTKDSIIIGNDTWSRNYEDLKRGSEVILYSKDKGYKATLCIANSHGFPPMFIDGSTLVEWEIIAVKNDTTICP